MTSTAETSAEERPERVLFPVVPPLPANGVLLHVGVHKTGTTAIQAALADARPELRQAKVLYPGKRKAQHRSAMAVTQRTWGWKGKGGDTYDPSVFDWLVKQTSGHPDRVAISSEFFCEGDAQAAASVVDALGPDRVHVVITLRNLGSLLPSSWQQYLKYGLTVGYTRWLTNMFSEKETGKGTPSFWKRNDHGDVARRWADAVGAANVTVMVLEDVDRSAMFRSFAQLLGVPEDVLVSRMALTSNRSMTAAEAEFLRRLNEQVNAGLTWDEYVKFVRRGVALGMVEGREPSADEPRLHTPDWALEAAAAAGARAASEIRDLGVRVLGDLDALSRVAPSPPPVPDGATETLPVDAAITAVMSMVEATRENPELSAKQLRDELLSRTKEDMKLRWRLKSLRP
jgi:hypothetical protein